jgi:hypothetical protein
VFFLFAIVISVRESAVRIDGIAKIASGKIRCLLPSQGSQYDAGFRALFSGACLGTFSFHHCAESLQLAVIQGSFRISHDYYVLDLWLLQERDSMISRFGEYSALGIVYVFAAYSCGRHEM